MFTMFLLIVGIELMVEGPVIVGLPILANTKLAEGALVLSVVLSAFAAVALVIGVAEGYAGLRNHGLSATQQGLPQP